MPYPLEVPSLFGTDGVLGFDGMKRGERGARNGKREEEGAKIDEFKRLRVSCNYYAGLKARFLLVWSIELLQGRAVAGLGFPQHRMPLVREHGEK